MLRRHGLHGDGYHRWHAVRGADAVIERGAVLRIAGRCSAVVMSQRVTGGMAVQGMRGGGLCFGTLRLTGQV